MRVVAIIGMLVHAALIVWHNASMVGATLERGLLAEALAICHATGPSGLEGTVPAQPGEGEASTPCPICKGLVGAVAVVPDVRLPEPSPDKTAARFAARAKLITARLAPVCPPSRGPPRRIET